MQVGNYEHNYQSFSFSSLIRNWLEDALAENVIAFPTFHTDVLYMVIPKKIFSPVHFNSWLTYANPIAERAVGKGRKYDR
jgi:hypothetical protein